MSKIKLKVWLNLGFFSFWAFGLMLIITNTSNILRNYACFYMILTSQNTLHFWYKLINLGTSIRWVFCNRGVEETWPTKSDPTACKKKLGNKFVFFFFFSGLGTRPEEKKTWTWLSREPSCLKTGCLLTQIIFLKKTPLDWCCNLALISFLHYYVFTL